MKDKFKKGDLVRSKKLKQDGLVLDRLTNGSYRVGFGSLIAELKERDMEPSAPDKWKKYSQSLKPKKLPIHGAISQEKFYETLDLHGLRVAEALPKVLHFIDLAILSDAPKAHILHGLGTGKLLAAVHDLLKKTSVVKKYELDPTNPGVTVVYF